MYEPFLDSLYIWLQGNFCRAEELIETISLDPERFAIEAKQWLEIKRDKIAISNRKCPDCGGRLEFGELSIEHICCMKCTKCNKRLTYF